MSENLDLKLTAEAWAEIVVERWENKISRLRIYKSGDLARSFTHHVISNANGNPELIEFTFLYYGKFVDMGVGNGIKYGEVEGSNRRPKEWYSKTFFSEIEKYKEIMADKFGQKAVMTIIDTIDENSGGNK